MTVDTSQSSDSNDDFEVVRRDFVHLVQPARFGTVRDAVDTVARGLQDTPAEQAHNLNVPLFSLLFGRYEGVAEHWCEVANPEGVPKGTPQQLEAARLYMRAVMLDIATVATLNVASIDASLRNHLPHQLAEDP